MIFGIVRQLKALGFLTISDKNVLWERIKSKLA